jgi:hypothetical protein
VASFLCSFIDIILREVWEYTVLKSIAAIDARYVAIIHRFATIDSWMCFEKPGSHTSLAATIALQAESEMNGRDCQEEVAGCGMIRLIGGHRVRGES